MYYVWGMMDDVILLHPISCIGGLAPSPFYVIVPTNRGFHVPPLVQCSFLIWSQPYLSLQLLRRYLLLCSFLTLIVDWLKPPPIEGERELAMSDVWRLMAERGRRSDGWRMIYLFLRHTSYFRHHTSGWLAPASSRWVWLLCRQRRGISLEWHRRLCSYK